MSDVQKPKHYCLACGSRDVFFEFNNGAGVGEKLDDLETVHFDVSAGVCRDCGVKGQIGISDVTVTVTAEF